MNLSEWLKEYRTTHGLSMQGMADLCGFSKAYIGVLEKGVNPKTFRPLSPSIMTFKKIADAVGMDFNEFLKILDDQPITIPHPVKKDLSEHDEAMVRAYWKAPETIQGPIDELLSPYAEVDLKSLAGKEKRNDTAM